MGIQTQLERFRLDAEKAVLLIIDVQEKLMAAMDHREQVCRNIRLMLTAAEQLHIPVVVTEQYPKGLGSTVPELMELMPKDRQLIEKTAFDAVGEELLDVLNKLNRRSILVCGTETHVCVYQTVRSLLSLDYQVFPVQDAICSRFTRNYKSGLELMARMGAVPVTAEGAAFDLLKVSGTPAFKAISKALK